MKTLRRLAQTVCVIGFLAASAVSVKAETPAQPQGNVAGGMLGILSFMATIPYGAAKITSATVGAIMGSVNYAEGDERAAREIWSSYLGGNYVLTPDHLRGREPIHFFGDNSPATPDNSGAGR